jgi:DNA-binding FrmR family transcriptional regulator
MPGDAAAHYTPPGYILPWTICYTPVPYPGPVPEMSHIIREKAKLLKRVRRIRGQVEAVERALEQEMGCADIMQLTAAARGAINGLMAEVMEDHIRVHVIDPGQPTPERAQATEDLIDVVRSYLK